MSAPSRDPALDQLRGLVVAGVVLLHAGIGFIPGAPAWWYVVHPHSSGPLGLLVAFLDGIVMPTCFLVAGEAAREELSRHAGGAYARRRLVRLVPPWLAGALLLAPIFALSWLASRGVETDTWSFLFDTYWRTEPGPSVYWFLPVLLALNLASPVAQRLARPPDILPLAVACTTLLATGVPLEGWWQSALLAVQPARLPVLVACYVVGFRGPPLAPPWLPLGLACIAHPLAQAFLPREVPYAAALLGGAFATSAMGGSALARALAARWLSKPRRFLLPLARHAMPVYLLHLVPLLPLLLWLQRQEWHPVAAALIAWGGALSGSLLAAIAQRCVRDVGR